MNKSDLQKVLGVLERWEIAAKYYMTGQSQVEDYAEAIRIMKTEAELPELTEVGTAAEFSHTETKGITWVLGEPHHSRFYKPTGRYIPVYARIPEKQDD